MVSSTGKSSRVNAACPLDGDRMIAMLSPDSVYAKETSHTVIPGSQLLALLFEYVIESRQQLPQPAYVVTNDATSGLVAKTISNYPVTLEETETGEVNTVSLMNSYNGHALCGGEGSNGGFILPPSQCRDGILAMMLLLKLIAETNSLEEKLLALPEYHMLDARVHVEPQYTPMIRKYLHEMFKTQNLRVQQRGGATGSIKVYTDPNDSWYWLRASKTEEGLWRIYSDSADQNTAKYLLQTAQCFFKDAYEKAKRTCSPIRQGSHPPDTCSVTEN
jgi:phosphomannomutase